MKKVIASIVAATLFLSNAAFLPHSVLVQENVVILANSVENNEYTDDYIINTINLFLENNWSSELKICEVYDAGDYYYGEIRRRSLYEANVMTGYSYKLYKQSRVVKIIYYTGEVVDSFIIDDAYLIDSDTEKETKDNSGNASLNEEDLKLKLAASYDYDMEGWTYADFDGDGTKEGFAAFVFNSGYSIPSVMRIGFIDADGNITFVSDRQCNALQNAITPTVKIDGKTFICFDTETGAGYFSLIFGVKNGKPYELKISQHTESLIQGDDGEVYTYRGMGPSDEKIKLIYDKNSQEFSKPEIYYFTVYQNSGEPVTLYKYTGYAEEIVIPEKSLEGATITKISDGEFTEYSEIKSILVPKTIEYIGEKSVGYYRDYFTGESGKVEGLVIKGYSGSAAEKYAKKNGFKFTSLNDSSVVEDTDDSNSNDQTIIPAITESDKEMISEVEKYCSDKDYEFRDRINDVLNSNTSWEIKQNELLKILSKYGINDIQEGMTYLRNRNQKTADALPYVYNYEFLVNDQIYCSSNFYNWLMSSEGMGARMALQTSSLIFNHEIKDAAFGDLFTDDPVDSNPNAKKNKKMLIDFLSAVNADYGDNLKDNSDLAEVLGDAYSLVKERKDAETYINEIRDFGKELDLDLPNLSRVLGYGNATFKFAGATLNDVQILMNMDEQSAIYESNRKFLETIKDSRNVSLDMRIAANSLLDDITNGFDKTIRHIVGNACQHSIEMQLVYYTDRVIEFETDIWSMALKELGIENAGSYIATYSVGVFITNALTGINKFTEEVAYSLGYAELSKLYSQKLKSDREEFLKDQSKEKAWQFFEDYTILWNLRYSGEEQYLKSQKVEGLFSSVGTNVQYLIKSLVAEETKSRLKEAKFYVSETIIIPDSVQYMKKAIINCPVDVYVYKGDELVVTLKDGTESDITNSYGRFSVVYNPCTDEYEKVICQSTDDDLDLKMVTGKRLLQSLVCVDLPVPLFAVNR